MRYTIIRGKGTRTWFGLDNNTNQQSGGRFKSKRDAFCVRHQAADLPVAGQAV
jgi:hypothetical protein